MTRFHAYVSTALLVLAGAVVAAPPADSPFTFPSDPPAPVPPVMPPAPGAMPTLTPGVWYIVESKVDAIPRVHPAALAKVTKEAGPQTIKGLFIDGAGKVETRKFTAPYLFFVEPTGTGVVEIDFVPIKDKLVIEDIGFRSIQVNNGTAPIPPPVDPPVPPIPPGPVTSFRVIFVYESAATLSVAQKDVIYGKAVADYLNVSCTKDAGTASWRRFDKDATAATDNATMKSLWTAVKPALTTVPCLVVEVNGKATILPLPATLDEALVTLKKYREGK